MASTILGSVGIAGLGVNTLVFDDVLEGIVHQTSSTTIVSLAGGAVDEVLLGEGNQVSFSEEPGTFHGSGGGEGPARSALTLILNWGDSSLGSPVDSVGEGKLVVGNVLLSDEGLVEGSQVSSSEFRRS